MPTKRALKRQQLTEFDLRKRAHTDPRAKKALDRFYELKKPGREPEIWYSEHNGYDVFDSVERASFLARMHREWH